MTEVSENSQLVLQRVVRVEEQVPVCVRGFPVDFNVEPSVLLKVYCTVQERQPVLFDILPCECNIAVYRAKVFHEGFYLLSLNLDQSLILIKPMAQCCSFKGAQCPTVHLYFSSLCRGWPLKSV